MSTTVISQKIADLPLYSGIGYRFICFGVFFVVTNLLLIRYASRIRKDPSLLPMYELDSKNALRGSASLEDFGTMDVRKWLSILCLALSTFDVVFHGVTTHAALAPEKGRSALDAMLLAFHGVELLREHVRDDVRMHYTLTELPGPENVVPARAAGRFSLRSYSREYLDEVVGRFREIIQGAAIMGGVTAEIRALPSLDNKIPVFSLNDLLMKHAALAGAPAIAPPREKTGSTDFGNVMHRLPGACIRVQFVPEGTPSHSQAYVDAGKSSQAHACVVYGAKILAGAVCDLIEKPKLLRQVKEEFQKNRAVY